MGNRIIEIVELGTPQSIIQREGDPITELIHTHILIEELNEQLTIPVVSNFVCPDCKGSNMVESNKREVWCYNCKKNYRENDC